MGGVVVARVMRGPKIESVCVDAACVGVGVGA